MFKPFANIHTRNFGCRIRNYILNGVNMLSLENQKIKVVLALDKGADMVEFVHKASDTDVLFHSFNPLKPAGTVSTSAASDGNFMDTYSGGWQELFPTHGANTVYHGVEIGFHGEACLSRWNFEIVKDLPECIEVHLTTRTLRTPFYLEKWYKMVENDPTIYIHEKITNEGGVDLDFMWGQHPAYGYPFLDDSVQLHLKGTPTVHYREFLINPQCPFDKETVGKWPFLPDRNGNPVDMSRARSAESQVYMEYGITDLEESSYELINHRKGLGVRMTWDPKIYKAIWIWGLYGGAPEFGRNYVMGVEPWTAIWHNYKEASAAGDLHHLAAGASVETDYKSELFESEADTI